MRIFFNVDTHGWTNSIMNMEKEYVIPCASCAMMTVYFNALTQNGRINNRNISSIFFLAERTFGPLRFGLIQNDCTITKTNVTTPWDCTKVQSSYLNMPNIFFEAVVIFWSFYCPGVTLFVWRSFWEISTCECPDMVNLVNYQC